MTTFYRVRSGDRVLGDGGASKEIQALLENADPVDVVTRDAPQDSGQARHWGKAIKHQDGTIHLESDQPGE
jgi:hypothetical protein